MNELVKHITSIVNMCVFFSLIFKKNLGKQIRVKTLKSTPIPQLFVAVARARARYLCCTCVSVEIKQQIVEIVECSIPGSLARLARYSCC